MEAIIKTDGGARPTNPGHAGFATIVEIDGEENKIARYIGWRSNNAAEYFGVIVGMKYAKFLGASHIEIFCDSKLVCKQLSGEFKVRMADLKPFADEAKKLFDEFDSAEIEWVGRQQNQKADALCTSAIYAGMLRNPFAVKIHKRKKGQEIEPFNGRATVNMLMPYGNAHSRSHAHVLTNAINSKALLVPSKRKKA